MEPNARFCQECGMRTCPSAAKTHSGEITEGSPDPTTSVGSEIPSSSGSLTKSQDKWVEQEDLSGNAERRHLTVMFCDLVEFTQLSVKLDIEETRDILAAFRTALSEIVGKFGSTVIQNYGDGALVMFGYPVAHENSTASAIMAGLEILQAFNKKSSGLSRSNYSLNVRIGITTGRAVVGSDGAGAAGEELSVIGDVPNLAARLQGLAKPGQIIVSKATYSLTQDQFNFHDMGAHNLKGFSDPVKCYSVDSSILTSARFAKTETGRSTPLISREAELALLKQRWATAKDGEGQVMLLSGEAGVGKSRILQCFNQSLSLSDIHLVRFFCSSFHTNSMLHPVLNDMRMRLRIDVELEDHEKFNQLKSQLSVQHHHHLPVLAKLFSIVLPDGDEQEEIPPESLKLKTFAAILDFYAAMADKKPLLMEFEDVHWCDPTTMEIISQFIGQLEDRNWFVLLAFRPDYKPPLRNLSYVTSLVLNRFGKQEIRELIMQVAGGEKLPQRLTDQIVERADGIPLFAEEITRMVLESDWMAEFKGHCKISDSDFSHAIPESLHGSLMARLDRFPSAKVVAQIAATIGRRFTGELLVKVSGHSESQLMPLLDQLLDAELIYEHGIRPQVIYEFKHALVQDAAYNSLLKTARQKFHMRIARALEQSSPEICESEPEILGHHFSAGGGFVQAVEYFTAAGRRALAVSANLEAINHLENALADIDRLPQTDDKGLREFELLVMLAVPQASAFGYSHENVSKTYNRAMELVKDIEEHSAIFPVTYGLLRYHLLGARYSQAQEYALSLSDLAAKMKNGVMVAASHRSMGAIHFYRGHPKQALEDLYSVINSGIDASERMQALKYDVVDLVVASLSYASWAEWQLGRGDTARELSAQAISMAKKIEHPFSISFSLCFASWTHAFCGDLEKTLELSEEALEISHKYSFEFWIGWAETLAAWSRSKINGEFETGVIEIAKGIEQWKKTGSRLGLSYFYFLQADLLLASGDHGEALSILTDADDFSEKTDELFWKPELLRLRGEVLRAKDKGKVTTGADTELFTLALERAEQMGSAALALRAATSLLKAQIKTNDKLDISGRMKTLLDGFSQGENDADQSEAVYCLSSLESALQKQ
jgi:predicted ATPase/class 3 adenylate cyclase